jgi:hypothetical protein
MTRMLIALLALVALIGACSEVDDAAADGDADLSDWCATATAGAGAVDPDDPDADLSGFEADLELARQLAENAPADVAGQAELVLGDFEDRSQRIADADGDMGADPGMSPEAEGAMQSIAEFRDRECP